LEAHKNSRQTIIGPLWNMGEKRDRGSHSLDLYLHLYKYLGFLPIENNISQKQTEQNRPVYKEVNRPSLLLKII
jgi:hypothetical protein